MLTYWLTVALAYLFASWAGTGTQVGTAASNTLERRVDQRLMVLATAAILISVSALRYRIGVDYRQYEENYLYDYRVLTLDELSWDSEPGIEVLAIVGRGFADDAALMFALASLLTIGLFVRTYAKYAPSFALAILFYVLVGSWHASFNGIRQYLAAAVLLAGHYFIIKRRFRHYLIVVALASLFHISAWLMLTLYLLPRRKLGWAGMLGILLAAVAVIFAYEFLGQVFDAVRNQDISTSAYFTEQVHPLRVALALVPYLLYAFFARSKDTSEMGHWYGSVALIHGAILLASLGSAYVARFAIYTEGYLPLALGFTLASMADGTRRVLGFALTAVYGAFWYLEVSMASALNPFRWITERL